MSHLRLLITLAVFGVAAMPPVPVLAQDAPAQEQETPPQTIDPEDMPGPDMPIINPDPEDIVPDLEPEEEGPLDEDDAEEDDVIREARPDYSHMTPNAEREARLDDLFAKLKSQTNADDASLVAEEIWAIWLDSGSASVNMLLRRGTAAEKRSDVSLARDMYDHVTRLEPQFAEGWARSGRLAYMQNDLSRAISEVTQALVLEPRHFYALWTLGNTLEKMGRNVQAYEAYQEAHELYPELEAVKNRVDMLRAQIDGQML